jgi:hypothetical protein
MRRTARLRAFGVCLAALVLASIPWSATAHAAEPSAADRASAKDFLREGKDLRDAGDHAGARKKFEAAYALVPTPITGSLLAHELVTLGLLVEARDVLGAIEQMPAKSTESADGRQARADASALLAEIMPQIPVLEVKLKGLAGGASVVVKIDGKEVPLVAAQQGIRVNPGKHRVAAKGESTERSQEVEAKAGQRATVELDLTGAAAPPKPPPPVPTPAPVKPAPVPAKPPPSAPPIEDTGSSAPKWIGVAGVGAGVVAIGVGGILGLSAKSTYNEATSTHCPTGPCDAAGQQGISDARSRASTATIVMGVGAVLAVGGAVLWLTAPRGQDAKVGITGVGVGASGVTIGGRF